LGLVLVIIKASYLFGYAITENTFLSPKKNKNAEFRFDIEPVSDV